MHRHEGFHQSGSTLSCIITSYSDKDVVLGSSELNPFQSSPIPIVTKNNNPLPFSLPLRLYIQ
ncbi:hypothetical protein BDV37DRAFT_264259 [Aspergillus pseudonomiae]|uniref:Uncharacterized protein n=1 Tax=Aspergillus pseudonomiae TaxID=1506151 RepID=A0A5N7CWW0_9EURO|nr:uncharacterized protein BDV37DRAFT_264259 [Aspergillus pseudonomiae]KAE8398083.1 hypothetical protein BDV37DRAFT_264259 [Aspergillus pseudonomiae]